MGASSTIEELARRVARLEAQATQAAEAHDHTHVYGIHGVAYVTLLSNASINDGATVTTGDLRGSYGVAANAKGVIAMLQGVAGTAHTGLYADSADDTPDGYSSRVQFPVATTSACAGLVFVRLGTGSNAGKIKVKANGGNFTGVYFWPVGYWV